MSKRISTLTLSFSDERDFSGSAYLAAGKVKQVDVKAMFWNQFADETDLERLPLLADILARPRVELKVYRDDDEAAHVFLVDDSESEKFERSACLLVTEYERRRDIENAPYISFESATVQFAGDLGADAEIVAAVRAWVRRLWPECAVPEFWITRCPEYEYLDPVEVNFDELTLNVPTNAGGTIEE